MISANSTRLKESSMKSLMLALSCMLASPVFGGVFSGSETIDFTGQSGAVSSPSGTKSFGGWRFTLDKPFTNPATPGTLSFGGAATRVEANDSNVAVLGGTGYKPSMILERSDGTAFSLGTIDFGGNIIDSTSDWASSIRITDVTSGGSGSFVDFTLSSSSNLYQTMSVQTTFANVKKVSFTGISSGSLANFTVDNIQIGATYDPPAQAVPEPSAVITMGLFGLAGFTFGRRRCRGNATRS